MTQLGQPRLVETELSQSRKRLLNRYVLFFQVTTGGVLEGVNTAVNNLFWIILAPWVGRRVLHGIWEF